MTEQVNVSESAQNQNSQPTNTQNISTGSQPAEKLLRQSEVNDLVGSAKHTSYEKGKQDALAELQKQQNVNTSVQQPTVNQQAVNQPMQLTPEQERKLADQAYQRLQNDQLVNQFAVKMTHGQQKYSDFEKVVTPLQMQNIPHVVQLANGFENTADIMYDLGKNPSKVSNLMVLAQINPQLARDEMQRLSDSIKKNETALANQKDVREPLSQVKSSNVGAGSGKVTSAERRQHPLYRT